MALSSAEIIEALTRGRKKSPFEYPFTKVLVASERFVQTITIIASKAFIWTDVLFNSTGIFNAQFQVEVEALSQSEIPNTLLPGFNNAVFQNPTGLTFPIIIPPSRDIQITLVDTSVAINTINMTLKGANLGPVIR